MPDTGTASGSGAGAAAAAALVLQADPGLEGAAVLPLLPGRWLLVVLGLCPATDDAAEALPLTALLLPETVAAATGFASLLPLPCSTSGRAKLFACALLGMYVMRKGRLLLGLSWMRNL
jgi:hypothetical protein